MHEKEFVAYFLDKLAMHSDAEFTEVLVPSHLASPGPCSLACPIPPPLYTLAYGVASPGPCS